jgi:serine protease Do
MTRTTADIAAATLVALATVGASDAFAQLDARRLRRSPVVEVVEQSAPAVVNIATEREPNPFFRGRRDDFFRFFGGPMPERRTQQSLGSGVIIDEEGLVLTNEHVIAQASNITVTLADRRTFEADVIGADRSFDIAVLRIRDARDLPVAQVGTSADLMPGETVVAIGNPFGLANSVTTGVVSALHRSIEADDRVYEDFVQIDAAINPGNSGGALLNILGELIGINTAIYGEANGIGFAIPIDKAKAVVQEVLRFGQVRPVYTGLSVRDAPGRGAEIVRIREDSPAVGSTIRVGDVVVDVSGQEVRTAEDFRQVERSLIPGQTAKLTVVRGPRGEGRRTVQLTVVELTAERAVAIGRERMGLTIAPRDGRLVVADVETGGPAAQLGIRAGDLFIGAFGQRIRSAEALEQVYAAASHERAVPLVIGRRGRAYYVNLELGP